MAFSYGKSGEQQLSKSGSGPLRLDKLGNLITNTAVGKYTEAALNGRIFYAHTADAGVAHGTALGTTGAFTLFNPKNNTKNLIILRGDVGYISGTMGNGIIVWAGNTNPSEAAPTGTAITIRSAIVSFTGISTALAFTTSTLAATPVTLRIGWNLGAANVSFKSDFVDGALIVPPGGSLTIHAIASAGTTPLVMYGCTWLELEIA